MAATDVRLTRDVEYGTAGGTPLYLDYAVPESGQAPARGLPVVLYIHGGAWLTGDRAGEGERKLMMEMARAGFFAVSVGYRLSTTAVFPAQIQDVWMALRWLRGYGSGLGADATRVGAWGHSAGGHLAALLGVSAGVPDLGGDGTAIQAVVPVSAPTDLATMGGTHDAPDSPESLLIGAPILQSRAAAARASAVAYTSAAVSRGAPAYLIVHGVADPVVPFSQAQVLHRALPSSALLAVGGADHDFRGGVVGWSEIIQAAVTFFRRHLS
jgi:acetyl esterase/lipase